MTKKKRLLRLEAENICLLYYPYQFLTPKKMVEFLDNESEPLIPKINLYISKEMEKKKSVVKEMTKKLG